MTRPGTAARSVRVALPLWTAALEVAGRRGETLSDVMRRALEEYVRQNR